MNIIKSIRGILGLKKKAKKGNGIDRQSGAVPIVIDPMESAAQEAEAELQKEVQYQHETLPGFHLKTEMLKQRLRELKEGDENVATDPAG